MCGLVGVAGSVFLEQKKVFQQLLLVNANRGLHGAGLASMYGTKKDLFYNVAKTEMPSCQWAFTTAFEKEINDHQMRALLGHSRHATQGKIVEKNNHPFLGKKEVLIGMHNGTIHGKFTGRDDFDTDSEALINLIEEEGLKKALEDVHEASWNPAYALALLDLDKEKVSLIRNRERTLFIAKAKGDIYWASQQNFLEYAFSQIKIDKYEIEAVPPFTLVEIFPFEHDKKRLKVTPNYFTPKPKQTYARVSNHPFRGSVNGKSKPVTSEEWANIFGDLDSPLGRTETRDSAFYSIGRRVVHSDYLFTNILSKGCGCCGDPVDGIEGIRFSRSQPNEFYCSPCKDLLKSYFDIDWDQLLPISKYESGDV